MFPIHLEVLRATNSAEWLGRLSARATLSASPTGECVRCPPGCTFACFDVMCFDLSPIPSNYVPAISRVECSLFRCGQSPDAQLMCVRLIAPQPGVSAMRMA